MVKSKTKSKIQHAPKPMAVAGKRPAHRSSSDHINNSVNDGVSAVLNINLDALVSNYRKLKKRSGKAECAAVVKANAYGLGDVEVVRTLVKQGCKTMFVANLKEAARVRRTSRKPDIFVLDGFHQGAREQYLKHRLRPVLNSLSEVAAWNDYAQSADLPQPAIHLETGMNRLGLPEYEINELCNNPELIEQVKPALIMSHLACADDPTHPLNNIQKTLFERFSANLPKTRLSLANSAGVTLGADYHYDLTRVGLALYGGEPSLKSWFHLDPVINLQARILQIHRAASGETIGYGATHTFTRPSIIATLSVGYADGIFRILGSRLSESPSYGLCNGQKAPYLGRVSMDLITVDVTDIAPAHCQPGDWVELIGPNNTVNDIAKRARTNAYEVLTSLGPRYHRIYKQG